MGKVGHKHTEESKEKMRKAHKGKVLTEEHKRKISEALGRRVIKDETRKKISRIHKGKTVSKETRRKMSESAKKKKLSEEHKRKISEAGKRRGPVSEETREKLSAASKGRMVGRKASEETRRKMSETRKGKKLTVTEKFKVAAARRGDLFRGIPRPPEEIEKRRQSMLKKPPFSEQHRERLSISGKGKHSGANAPAYIDGRSREKYPYPAEFTDYLKKKVRKRDNQTCQACFETAKGKRGFVHHVDGDKPNCSMENLVLVCCSCHNKIHSYSPNHSERIVYFRGLLKPENRPFRASLT